MHPTTLRRHEQLQRSHDFARLAWWLMRSNHSPTTAAIMAQQAGEDYDGIPLILRALVTAP